MNPSLTRASGTNLKTKAVGLTFYTSRILDMLQKFPKGVTVVEICDLYIIQFAVKPEKVKYLRVNMATKFTELKKRGLIVHTLNKGCLYKGKYKLKKYEKTDI